MFGSTLFGITLLAALTPLVSAGHIMNMHHRHDELVHTPVNSSDSSGTLEKRQSYTNARFTFYAAGLGACGVTNQPSDFIVALDSILYDQSNECFKMITISYGGKSTQAQVTDRCPGCPEGGLDLSEGLFTYFADEGAGVIYGEWSYGSGGGEPTTSTSQWVPPTSSEWTTSSTWAPTTTSDAWTPTTTSTTWTPSSSSSSSSWSRSSSSGSSASSSDSASSSSAAWSSSSAAASASASAIGNTLEMINQAVVGIAGLMVAGAEA